MNEIDNIEKLMKDKEVQFRDFRAAFKENSETDEEFILEGTPCVFGSETILYSEDGYELREVVDSGAFDGADISDVIFNYNHCGRVYARTRNNTLKLHADETGLHIRAQLLKNDEGHRALYRDISSGLIDKMSFAFTVAEQEFRRNKKESGAVTETRIIKKFKKIHDVSAVDIPAYNATEISARRAFEAEREQRIAESKKRAVDILKIKLKTEV